MSLRQGQSNNEESQEQEENRTAVDVKRRAPKKEIDAQLLADAEAAERQRRRAKKRSDGC